MVGQHRPLLGVALLKVAGQVVTAAEALRTAGTKEVAAARVHHGVPPHVLASVEAAVTSLARVLPLAYSHASGGGSIKRRWRPVYVTAQLLQQRPFGARQACCSRGGGGGRSSVSGHQVASVAQLGVVLLPAVQALKELLVVGVVAVVLPLEVLLLVKHHTVGGAATATEQNDSERRDTLSS